MLSASDAGKEGTRGQAPPPQGPGRVAPVLCLLPATGFKMLGIGKKSNGSSITAATHAH